MAERRGLENKAMADLIADGAVGEAIGQYCDINGKVVYVTNNAGLMMNDLKRINKVIGLAGGKSKAQAILSVIRASHQDILVTDEAAARDIVKML